MTPLAQLIDAVKATNKSNISRYRNEDPLISIKRQHHPCPRRRPQGQRVAGRRGSR